MSQPLSNVSQIYALVSDEMRRNEIMTNIPKGSEIHTTCKQPICPPGYQKVFAEFQNHSTAWDLQIGYQCLPCKPNHYKNNFGDEKCQKCQGYFVPNTQKTNCIDPLNPIYLNINQLSGIILITICTKGAILSFVTAIIFIKNRETPVVKLSELIMSMVQLSSLFVIFFLTPLLYLSKPSPGTCIGKTLLFSYLYNINVSITCLKTVKLVKAITSMSKIQNQKF